MPRILVFAALQVIGVLAVLIAVYQVNGPWHTVGLAGLALVALVQWIDTRTNDRSSPT